MYYREISDFELLKKWKSGGLTKLGQEVVLDELRQRNLDEATGGGNESEVETVSQVQFSGFEIIYSAQDPTEAHILRARLEFEGIPTHVSDEHLNQVHSLMANALGGVRLWASHELAKDARQILAKILAGEFSIDESNPVAS